MTTAELPERVGITRAWIGTLDDMIGELFDLPYRDVHKSIGEALNLRKQMIADVEAMELRLDAGKAEPAE